MELLEDGLRSLARNFSALMLGLVLVIASSAAYSFTSAMAIKNLYPELLAEIVDADPVETSTEDNGAITIEDSGAYTSETSENTVEIGTATSPGPPPVAYILVNIVSEVIFAIAIATIYAFVLAMLGRSIDRPLWKCDVPAEAIRRFFTPWFIMILATLALRDFQGNAEGIDTKLAIEMFLFCVGPFIIPVGACVMHHGALNWEEIGAILAPIGRQFRMVLAILFVAVFQYILQESVLGYLPRGAEALYTRAFAVAGWNGVNWVIDALMFCMMWRVCILDRDSGPHEREEFDEE